MDAALEASKPTAIEPTANNRVRHSPTWLEKLTVSGTAFGFSTAAFIFSTLVLIPYTNSFLYGLRVSESIQQVVVLAWMFGLPILAALYGVRLGSKMIFSSQSERYE